MSQIRAALSMIVMNFIGPIVLMILGAVIALALFQGEGAGRGDPKPAKGVSLSDDGETIRVALEVEAGKASKAMMLHGPSGKELARFHVYRDGRFTLEPSGTNPCGFTVHRDASGSISMGLAIVRGGLTIEARADSSVKILFRNADGKTMHELNVDAEGRVLSHATPSSGSIE